MQPIPREAQQLLKRLLGLLHCWKPAVLEQGFPRLTGKGSCLCCQPYGNSGANMSFFQGTYGRPHLGVGSSWMISSCLEDHTALPASLLRTSGSSRLACCWQVLKAAAQTLQSDVL